MSSDIDVSDDEMPIIDADSFNTLRQEIDYRRTNLIATFNRARQCYHWLFIPAGILTSISTFFSGFATSWFATPSTSVALSAVSTFLSLMATICIGLLKYLDADAFQEAMDLLLRYDSIRLRLGETPPTTIKFNKERTEYISLHATYQKVSKSIFFPKV